MIQASIALKMIFNWALVIGWIICSNFSRNTSSSLFLARRCTSWCHSTSGSYPDYCSSYEIRVITFQPWRYESRKTSSCSLLASHLNNPGISFILLSHGSNNLALEQFISLLQSQWASMEMMHGWPKTIGKKNVFAVTMPVFSLAWREFNKVLNQRNKSYKNSEQLVFEHTVATLLGLFFYLSFTCAKQP